MPSCLSHRRLPCFIARYRDPLISEPQVPYLRIRSCVFLPAAGRRMQLHIFVFKEPGVRGLADPCRALLLLSRGGRCGKEGLASFTRAIRGLPSSTSAPREEEVKIGQFSRQRVLEMHSKEEGSRIPNILQTYFMKAPNRFCVVG